jgi:hypothetical protein
MNNTGVFPIATMIVFGASCPIRRVARLDYCAPPVVVRRLTGIVRGPGLHAGRAVICDTVNRHGRWLERFCPT